jgi:SagB-type dehydrogenase family enzyme
VSTNPADVSTGASASPARPAAGAGNGSTEVHLDPDLKRQLEVLAPVEQAALAEMLERVKTAPLADGRPFDPVFLIHQYLKAVAGSADLAATEEEVASAIAPPTIKQFPGAEVVVLPKEYLPIDIPLDAVMRDRFSSHNYSPKNVSMQTLSTLLHYAYGTKRTVRAYNVREFPVRWTPSAGGLQPIDLYMVANDVEGLRKGLYYYDHLRHVLLLVDEGNMRQRLLDASIYQDWVLYAPVMFIMVCNFPRVFWKYRSRGYRFVHADAGVLAQSFYLVATALKLNTCAVAAYYDDKIHELVGVNGRDEFAILLFGTGHKPTPRTLAPANASGTSSKF